jgi:hypothetical protein
VRGEHALRDPSSGEEFNLNNLDVGDSDEASDGHAVPHSPASIIPTAGSSAAPTRPASPDLLVPPPIKTSRKAEDIEYFFIKFVRQVDEKTSVNIATCKLCKYVAAFPQV